MKIAIIGTNGMLSKALTQLFHAQGDVVVVYGLEPPTDYLCSQYLPCNLLVDRLDYESFRQYGMVIYAAGAGVQAALSTPSEWMYALNVTSPIAITIGLKNAGFNGVFVSFGSYMEIGINQKLNHAYTESEIVCSSMPVSNDYALSKRLFTRYMNDINVSYLHWHFILPNMFSKNDMLPGTRLIPYVIQCAKEMNEGNEVQPSFSSGRQIRQFIQLEELINVINLSYEKHLDSGIYCVGGGEIYSIRDLIERIFNFYGIKCSDSWFGTEIRRDNDIRYLAQKGKKLYDHIGYLPKSKIENLLM